MSTQEDRTSQAYRIALAQLPPNIQRLYEEATLSLYPDTAEYFDHSRNHTYDLAAAGKIPVIQHGTKKRVSTRWLRQALGYGDTPPGYDKALAEIEREEEAEEVAALALAAKSKRRKKLLAAVVHHT